MKSKSILIVVFACLCSFFLGATWDKAPLADLVSQIIPLGDEIKSEEDWGDLYLYSETATTYGTKDLLTGWAEIKPGQQIHPPHTHAEEEILVITEGEGTWSLDGKESPAKIGDMMYSSPWIPHGLTNTGSETLKFFVVKWNNKGIEVMPEPK